MGIPIGNSNSQFQFGRPEVDLSYRLIIHLSLIFMLTRVSFLSNGLVINEISVYIIFII